MLRCWLAAILLGISAVGGLAQPQGDTQPRGFARFCTVPVKDGGPTEADVGQARRITHTSHRISGLPSLVFTPHNRRGQWTIDGDRRLVPYAGPYPHSYLDQGKWVTEPWSGRTVSITWGGGVSALRPGTERFERLHGDEEWRGPGSFNSIQLLPRRKLTIVTNGKGVPLVVEDNALRPWLTPEQMAAHSVRGIFHLFDAATLSATIILDLDGWLHIVTDDDRWQRLSSIKPDTSGRIFADASSRRVLFLGAKTVVSITKNENGGFSAERLLTTAANGADLRYRYHTTALLHQVLSFDGGGPPDSRRRWRRLGPNGFEDIPGGDIGLANKLLPHGRVHELPSLGKVLLEGRDGLFLYDGRTIAPIADSSPLRFGSNPRVYDLVSLKRVIVSTHNGLFEITADGRLVARPMPFPTDGLPQIVLKDWPESGVALVSTRDGLFTLDATLEASPVEAGNLVGLGWLDAANNTNPGTGEMVLTGSRGVFLAVDSRRSPDVCAHRREAASRVGDLDICLKPIAGTDVSDVGFAAGAMIEAPEGRGILVDTVRGLFLLDADDKLTPLQPRTGQFTRSLANLPWSGEVFAGGVIDTVIGRDLSVTELTKRRYSRLLGIFPSIQSILVARDSSSGTLQLAQFENGRYRLIDTRLTESGVSKIVDAPWFGAAIMANSNGLFSLDREGRVNGFAVEGVPSGQTAMGFFATTSGFGTHTFFAVPRLRTIYASRQGWHRITPERRWLPLEGLDADVKVLAVLDPGSAEALLGTSTGIFAVSADGQARRLPGEGAPRRSIRALAASARPGVILAGGDDGLFEIDLKSMAVRTVPNGADDVIGSVQRIVSTPFAKLDIVEASNGTYALDETGLHRIRELSAASNATGITAFDTAKRVLAKATRQEGALLFELLRRDARGACAASL